jgi:predicted phage terminase large subunit-like protein
MSLESRYGASQLENLGKLSPDLLEIRAKLQSDLTAFTAVFFKRLTGRGYIIPNPEEMESHVKQICDALTDVHEGRCKRLMIHVPPRAGKSNLVIFFIAWAMSISSKCNFIYASYGYDLVVKHTSLIREIMQLPDYKQLFGIELSRDTNSKDYFRTRDGGEVMGAGTGGAILGNGAGVRGCKNYFSGALIIDDAQNPDKIFISKTESDNIYNWYTYKALDRLNGLDYQPIILICHRMGNNDLPQRIIENSRPGEWRRVVVPALYDNETKSFYPEEYSVDTLLDFKSRYKYLYHTKMQQSPLTDTTNLFPEQSFEIKNEEPEILFTFITADTAETEKTYNDPSVFSFFGVYKIEKSNDLYGLHWIDCEEMWVEPKDLESRFMQFYSTCCQHKHPPSFVAIEKKSTGVTLLSVLKAYQGMEMVDVNRTSASKDKISRFISIQPYINKRLISFTKGAKHMSKCIEHCIQICPDGSHARDDIADTLYDGVKLGLMDKAILQRFVKTHDNGNSFVSSLASDFMNIQRLKEARYSLN